ncbi:uncharacterized protein LOC130191306 [Pseudoliparis swirei]|uniref:uncharacterized protein LOC130191306 n=1 Tax=Pseudoliparis swirei TaxID=2059687 RepID=UPI0024BDB8CC|nr:uncharacterized protein LOC130191306 [Pseudoliparis swirei]
MRLLVKQRVHAAVEESSGLLDTLTASYEDTVSPLREHERHASDVQQLLVVKEEVPSEQQVWSSRLDQVHPEPPLVKEEREDQENPEPPHIKEDQENSEPPHIKEEQEELWTSQEGEQLQGLEEAGLNFSFTPVKLKRKPSPLRFIKDKLNRWKLKLMEMILEDQNQPGTQIQIDLQILMKRLETLQNQILMRTLLNQILMTLLIGRRPENLNQV